MGHVDYGRDLLYVQIQRFFNVSVTTGLSNINVVDHTILKTCDFFGQR